MAPENKAIPQIEPNFNEKEADAVYEYMRNGGWVTEFEKTRDFEEEIRKFCGAKYCSIVSNGTISLTLGLLAGGINKNDEVLVPAYTMAATANAVSLTGASVVFADVNIQTGCLGLAQIKMALSPRTKAVILVSINGRYPEDLEEIVAFCKDKKLLLLEDAAQSLGSFKGSKHLGTFGDIGSFSFAMPKIITTGQGGALITDDKTLIEKIRYLRDFGREKMGEDHYLTMGWNFKFTDIQAVIGLEQMKKLPSLMERKKEIFSLYFDQLKDVSSVKFLPTNLKETTPMFVDILLTTGTRSGLVNHLKSKKISTRLCYPALHMEPVYGLSDTLTGVEHIAQNCLWLPSSSKLSNEDVRTVCDEIKNFFAKKEMS